MYEKEDAPTERVKLLTLLSGEEDFELSRWAIFLSGQSVSSIFFPFGEIIWWGSSGELPAKGGNLVLWPYGFAGAEDVTTSFLCLEPHFFAHDFVVLKPDITGFMFKGASI